MKVKAPPIKCQGIKTKLVPLIREVLDWDFRGTWIEPFTGSGVVGFNLRPKVALFADSNPHTIKLYEAIRTGSVTSHGVKNFLTEEGATLKKKGEEHYYAIRERFNKDGDPLDFLFLNRACFNGVMRFNRKGGFNVPFCRKPDRFAQAYVTKITNQVEFVAQLVRANCWQFVCQGFEETIQTARECDFIYVDPPYVGRHVDYFDSWDEDRELRLFRALKTSPARFILSTWEENTFRRNAFIDSLWGEFPRVTEDHFYHVGAREVNRNAMREALVMNYDPPSDEAYREQKRERVQLALALS
ncbi:MAG: Dam family site-specific DNA-(adenine-N6)-methyltransferase [Fimbriimonadaceae bacterium]|nr:Dam family site-specific DNA-(adenine-N6)-methyltransferase [Fimbriimonadaceae bacterium]